MKIRANLIYNYLMVAFTFFLCQSSVYSRENARPTHQTSNHISNEVASYWKNKDYDNLGRWLSKNLGKKINLKQLYNTAAAIDADGLKKAIRATMNISAKCKGIKISKGEILQLALFIETEMKDKVNNDKYYFDSQKTNLPRSIEVDPKNGNIIVYLEKKNFSTVGRGRLKNFNRALLYNVHSPEIVTTGFLKVPKEHSPLRERLLREVEVMKKLKGEKGIVKFYSIFKHNSVDSNNDEIVFVEKLYKGGSIRSVLKKRNRFTKSEKIKMAADLIEGLRTMHKRGMTHGDLHSGNYLIDVDKKSKKRKVAGVLTDFAKVRYFDKGSESSNVKQDIHKLGRVLHGLFHNYTPSRGARSIKHIRQHGFNFDESGRGSKNSTNKRFESLILRMVGKNKINADELVEEINKIKHGMQ